MDAQHGIKTRVVARLHDHKRLFFSKGKPYVTCTFTVKRTSQELTPVKSHILIVILYMHVSSIIIKLKNLIYLSRFWKVKCLSL